MSVINQRNTFYLVYKKIGQKCIKIVGNKHISFAKKQKEKQPQIIFGVEKRSRPES